MQIFQEKRSLQDDCAVVDMGEYSAKLCLCRKKGSEVLLEGFRIHEYTKVRTEERIKEAIDAAASFASRKIAFTFSPSILRTRVILYSLQRPNPRAPIQEKEQQELEKKITREIEKKGKDSIASQSGILGDEFVCVRSSLLAMRIDGYEVPHLKGFSGETVAFSMVLTFLLEAVRSSLAKSLLSSTMKLQGIEGGVYCLEKFCGERSLASSLFVDVGDMGTRFFLFSGGDIVFSGEFKKGGDRYTHVIEQSLGMSRQSALELKHRYALRSGEGVSEGVRGKLAELFAPEFTLWKQELSKALAAEGKTIPGRVFLFGGGSMLPEMTDLFEEGSLLPPRDIIPHSSFSPQYTSLALCAVAIVSHEQKSH